MVNIGNMMKQAQQLQKKMSEAQEKLNSIEVEGSSGGGVVKVISTATDVIHSFSVSAFGIKIDGVPGRAQDTWFEILNEGTYYGQCSELCGMLHGFMPVMVKAVSESEFDNWVQNKKAAAKKNEEIKKVEIIK